MNDDEKLEDTPLAIMGSTSSLKTMADGSLRIAIDVSPKDSKPAFALFGSPGTAVALAVIKNEVAVEFDRPKEFKHQSLGVDPKNISSDLKTEFGEYARALKLSDFFRTPAVWQAVGTNHEYMEWLKRQKSALSGEFSEYHIGTGAEFCIPAHVRRVEFGSGTAIKPPYSAIPLTDAEHKKAHQEGDSAIGTEEWWAKMRIKYVSDWCWATLKETLQSSSWADLPPRVLVDWCSDKGLLNYLPNAYRGWITDAEGETSSEDG